MESLLQQELSKGKNVINLPYGEFKENVIIDRPCTIIGNNTTLWNENLPVLIVQSKGVILKNLRLELTSIGGFESNYPVLKLQSDTITENVEIFGGLADTKKYYIPRMIHLGNILSNCENTFKLKIFIPESCTIITKSNNFTVEPTHLQRGYTDLTIKTALLDDNSMIYGEILFQSSLIRRVYVDGHVSNNAYQIVDKSIYSYENADAFSKSDVILLNIPKVDNTPKKVECKILNRGERTIVNDLNISIKLNYTQSQGTYLDIDPYIFLTDHSNSTRYNEDMIFFGNPTDINMSICIQDDNSILIDLNKVPKDVHKVSICYSIYKGGYSKNFSTVINPVLNVRNLNGNDIFKIPLQNLGYLSTVIVSEIYRYKNLWEINPVVAGFNNGLPRLCQSFGIDADY